LAFFMAEARKHKVMTRDEEQALARKVRAGGAEGMEARNEFVRRNMRLVVTIARKYACEDMPLPDLVQEGCIGLMRALDKFDADKGFKFSTYASWWVRQAVVRSMHNAGAIRLPSFMVTARHQLLRVEGQAKRTLTPEELQELTGFSPTLLKRLRVLPVAVAVLDGAMSEDGDVLMVDTVADPSGRPTPEREMELARFRTEVERTLQDEAPRDRDILLAWAGGEASLEELGRGVGLTRERVRQIIMRMLATLKRRLGA
jgi:RNA polymerase primary sigma factor